MRLRYYKKNSNLVRFSKGMLKLHYKYLYIDLFLMIMKYFFKKEINLEKKEELKTCR